MSGSRYVGEFSSGSSFTMAIATAVAILCYTIVIFLLGVPERPPTEQSPV